MPLSPTNGKSLNKGQTQKYGGVKTFWRQCIRRPLVLDEFFFIQKCYKIVLFSRLYGIMNDVDVLIILMISL